jgi:hypothetical protein
MFIVRPALGVGSVHLTWADAIGSAASRVALLSVST